MQAMTLRGGYGPLRPTRWRVAENVDITPGSGKTIAADTISAVEYQRMKLIHGADGTNDGDVQRYNGLPLSFALPKTKRCSQVLVAATASGDTEVVALTASQTIRVFGAFFINNGDAEVTIHLRSANTPITPNIRLFPGGSWFLPHCGEPYFITASGEALDINLSVAGTVGGWVDYEKSA